MLESIQPEFTKALLKWFKKNRRDLPWREQPSLYKTVVSEFMLQQTQVNTVLPYFDRWLKRFPDFASLARAKEDSVVKMWEGLGYYSRARNLHKLAKEISKYDEIPETADEWIKFPGIGPYASAAVTSIAFGQPEAVIDGNVIRIITRLLEDKTRYKDNSSAMKALKPAVDALLNKKSPGMHNEAMMELGALICSKNKPQCNVCPVSKFCKAFQSGNPEKYPIKDSRKTVKVSIQRLWAVKNGKILLEQKSSSAKRLKGIFEFPNSKLINISNVEGKPICKKKRAISNQQIEEVFYNFSPNGEQLKQIKAQSNLHWVDMKKIENLTLSGPHRKWYLELELLSSR